MTVHSFAEGDSLVEIEWEKRCQNNRKAFGYQWVPMAMVDT